ncbi:glycosyltransferase family 2 protein [Leifsonia sp. L25]|uniref:glycosyltransferase family 2 protein n=1 Tax=Actinomycetes TaxID=1760 RepID=UPI003D68EDE9
MTATVRVVTVTYNSSRVLTDFLGSVGAAAEVTPAVTVVDNASRDLPATREIVAAHPGTELIESPDNLGYGAAMNLGVRARDRADYYLLANPDLIFQPGTIDLLVAAAEAAPGAGALGPAIFNSDGTLYPSARALPSLRNGIGHALFSRSWPSNPWTRSYRPLPVDHTEPVAVGWLSGACLLVRDDAFRRIGGFDESFFMYFEDVDFGRRIGLAGLENLYVPAARAIHSGAHSTSERSESMDRAHHDSAYLYLSRVYSGALLAPVRLALRAGLWVRGRWAGRRAHRTAG